MMRLIVAFTLAAAAASVPAAADLIYLTSNQIQIVDTEAGRVVGAIDLGRSLVRDVVFSRDGKTAYVAHSKGISCVDVAASRVTDTLSDVVVSDLILVHDTGELYSLQHAAGRPSEAVVYDTATGREIRRFQIVNRAWDVAVPGMGDRLYTSSIRENRVHVYDKRTGTSRGALQALSPVTEADANTYIIRTLASPDGRWVYVVLNGEKAGIRIVDAVTDEAVRTIDLDHPAYVRDAALSPDGTRAYLSAIDHLSVVDLATGAEIAWLAVGLPHQGIAVSPDGERIYMANPIYGEGGSVTIIDATKLEVIGRVEVPEISPYLVAVVP